VYVCDIFTHLIVRLPFDGVLNMKRSNANVGDSIASVSGNEIKNVTIITPIALKHNKG
jgi:hypothetical protein